MELRWKTCTVIVSGSGACVSVCFDADASSSVVSYGAFNPVYDAPLFLSILHKYILHRFHVGSQTSRIGVEKSR